MQQQADGVAAEARKTKETASRLANGEATEEADQVRVLAGMIQQLAEQIERLAADQGTEQTPSRMDGPPAAVVDGSDGEED